MKKFGLISLFMASSMLVACGGKKTSAEAETKVTADITRPPQMVRVEREQTVQETNPDATISYEEWLKQQQAEGDQP